MKKMLFFAAIALAALGSCTSDEFVGENNPNETNENYANAIVFGTGVKAVTRADKTGSDAATLLNNNFVVEGFKWNGNDDTKEVVFDHYNVNWSDNTANTTTSNTANWEYVGQTKHQYGPAGDQTIKYWDYAKSQYDFIAWSAGLATAIYTGTPTNGQVLISEINPNTMNGTDANNNGKIDENEGAYTIKGNAADLAKVYIADLVTIYRGDATNHAAGNYGKEVDIKFRSLSSKVRIGLYEIVPGYSVKDVVFYTDASTKDTPTSPATWGNAHLYTTSTDVFNGAGTYIVYYPTTGADKAPGGNNASTDYNKAHLQFEADANAGTSTVMGFGALKGSLAVEQLAAAEKAEATGNLYLGRSSNTAIYAGTLANNYYTVVIPNESGATLNLKVDYTLVSTDGDGETINVTGATAQVPAEYAQWKSGYAYTYLFKISQNGNGYTDPSLGPSGLFPITFDAVVVDSEADGIQETITTVAEPSITTYSKGKIVTENNEYVSGNKIYVVVEDDGSVATLSATNAKLYTVTLTDGDDSDGITTAAQTINEASVANALAQGGSVTDINKFTLAVTEVDNGTLTYPGKIAAADAPDGNEINVSCALFTAGEAGTTYVFEYIKNARTYYTQDEANTYNEALPGAIKTNNKAYSFTSYADANGTTQYGTGKVKEISKVGEWTTVLVTSNSIEGFVGKEYKVHATTLDANTFYELYTTAGAATGIYVKVESGTFTDEEVKTYNATLPGAVSTSTIKDSGKYGYKIIKIAE